MASERQLRANRLNAQKSTGPKSHAGKKRISQNAYRHGLRAGILPDSDWTAKVEALAREIVGSTGGQIDLGQARSVAHAQLEVLRARSINTAVVAQILAGCNHSGWTPAADCAVPPKLPDGEPGRTADAPRQALFTLKVLDRYVSRAVARRDRVAQDIIKGCGRYEKQS
jgi:hypothetical protein